MNQKQSCQGIIGKLFGHRMTTGYFGSADLAFCRRCGMTVAGDSSE